jgi:multidrug efflux pump subunit AcrA (membrane-fusion protein)
MKNAFLLCLIMALALLAVSCGRHEKKKPDNVAYYTCTMHPSVRSQDPDGKCPICGMSLVPVLVQTNAATATTAPESAPHTVEFNIPERRQQLIGVTYATVETRPLQSTIRAPGVVTFDPLRRWSYVSRVEGYVEKLEVSSAGQKVENGQALLTLHSPDLLVAEHEYVDLLQNFDRAKTANLQAAIDTARQNLDAARRRLQFWNIEDAEIERLEKTRQPGEYLTLYSPFQGVVWNLQTGQGRRVTAGDALVEVIDLSAVWVWVDFYQDDLPLLTNGLPVTITSETEPTPLDAIPDLSDVQVIVSTDWDGRSPDLVEDQITYPISTRFIAAPKVKFVRGESMFGKSFVYVIFEDGTDIYWARSRVIEYLNSVRGSLPEGVNPVIGPDATGVGWVYEYALVDESGRHKPGRACAPSRTGICATRSNRSRAWPRSRPSAASSRNTRSISIRTSCSPTASLADVIVRGSASPTATWAGKFSSRLDGVLRPRAAATSRAWPTSRTSRSRWRTARRSASRTSERAPRPGPAARRGRTGRKGRNGRRHRRHALRRERADGHRRRQEEIAEMPPSLPPGREDRAHLRPQRLIRDSIATLREKLIEESIVVALVCLVFLWHVRSALVAIITLPVAIVLSFLPMYRLGLTSNIMSLGGIAIAIGAMVDAAIIMVENAHKSLEHFREEHGRSPDAAERTAVIIAAARAWAGRCFSRCWSSRSASCRFSRCRRRRGGSSSRWPSPRTSPCSSPRCWA